MLPARICFAPLAEISPTDADNDGIARRPDNLRRRAFTTDEEWQVWNESRLYGSSGARLMTTPDVLVLTDEYPHFAPELELDLTGPSKDAEPHQLGNCCTRDHELLRLLCGPDRMAPAGTHFHGTRIHLLKRHQDVADE